MSAQVPFLGLRNSTQALLLGSLETPPFLSSNDLQTWKISPVHAPVLCPEGSAMSHPWRGRRGSECISDVTQDKIELLRSDPEALLSDPTS